MICGAGHGQLWGAVDMHLWQHAYTWLAAKLVVPTVCLKVTIM
jgi:hypothetical protein